MSDLGDLQAELAAFRDERDWAQFHDPKSLLLALVGEVGELAELYQWLPHGQAAALAQAEPLRTRTGEEMADVLSYLLMLADAVGIDLMSATRDKLDKARARFPVDQFLGQAPKKT
ncbi:MAG: MazG nucleotide pyrophosphohydrolase [Pseudonocardiales bacterium]|nr:MazG nucleotide pyrophosphohydrolase [Pseudonocardiales bacterium]